MRVKTGALLLLAFIVGCLAPIATSPPAQAVQGDVEWTRMVPHHYYPSGSRGTGVITHGDGTVTATACGNTANLEDAQSTTLSPSGDVLGTITGLNQGAVCQNRGVAGIDGMLFYSEQLTSPLNVTKLVAMKNGVQIASHSITYQCSIPFGTTYYGIPQGMKIGADGNLYAVVIRNSCSTKPDLLVSLNGQSGQIRFQEELTYGGGDTNPDRYKIGVYDSGLVVAEDRTSSLYPHLLSYYDYSGTKNNTLSCAIDSATDSCGFSYGGSTLGYIRRIIVEPNGTTYIEAWGGTCSTRYKFKYTVAGVGSTVTPPTSCTELWLTMPNGNLVFSDGGTVVVTNSSGVTQYSGGLASKPGYTFIRNPYPVDLQIDGNGDVVVLRYARLNTSSVRHVYVDKLNANSTWTTLFSTEQLPNPNGNSFYLEPAYEVPNVAFAKDYMYLAVCRAACSSTNGPIVSRISMPGMEVEYPRSAIFAEYTSNYGEQLDYVALGDSFSSGEGVPAFITGTDTAGPPENRCHRSLKAYPMLLDQEVDYDLNLRAFRACSGAKMENITTTGQWGESKQLSSLNAATDLVTITIGGNDVEFTNVGFACNFDSGTNACMNQLNESNQIVTSQAFSDSLYATLEAVENAAPNAGVIVNGYPYILSTPGVSTYCGWAVQAASQAEREAVEGLVDSLNAELSNAAVQLGMVYVDPRPSFDGHYPCFPVPYLNEADPVNHAYSYHPNEEGQAQYVTLLDEWLS